MLKQAKKYLRGRLKWPEIRIAMPDPEPLAASTNLRGTICRKRRVFGAAEA